MHIVPTVHLVCGSTGAGKTTYSLRLSERLRATHFSIDDWMVTLFAADMPRPPDWTWISERAGRCQSQIMTTACALGSMGSSSILDLGWLRADQRQHAVSLATERGMAVQLHFLDVDIAERWRRVKARNAERGETFRLTVTAEMFEFIEKIWEPPSSEEMAAFHGMRI